VLGGLGGAVAEAVAEHGPTRVARVGIVDAFSARPGAHREQLFAAGVSPDHIVAAAEAIANVRASELTRFMPTISQRGHS
jgi:transketolase